jgi:dGTP triphosphohydrolase
VVEFSVGLRHELNELRTFLMQKLYLDPRVAGGKEEGKAIVKKLCTAYEQKPDPHILDLQKRTESSLVIAIKDYVAGMTDGFAREQVSTL